MKIKSRTLIIWINLICLFTSCINQLNIEDEQHKETPTAGNIPIQTTDKTFIKALHEHQISNPAVGFYLYVGSDSHAYLSNEPLSYTEDYFSFQQKVYYPTTSSDMQLFTYFPYQKQPTLPANENIHVYTLTDQSSKRNYLLSDFLVSRHTLHSPYTKPVSLKHKHCFSQLNISLRTTDPIFAQELVESNPTLKLCDVFCEAVYTLTNEQMHSLHHKQNVLPHGEWMVKDYILTGKSCMVIPQILLSGQDILQLTLNNKTYRCQLATSLELEAGKAYTLMLTIDSKDEISAIIPSITDWVDGGTTIIQPEEKFEKDHIKLSELDFTSSPIYTVRSNGEKVAELCLEYLQTANIAQVAIVAYPIINNQVDLTNGIVVHIKNQEQPLCGGKVAWVNGRLVYTPGCLPSFEKFYLASDGTIQLSRPASLLFVEAEKELLVDERSGERCTYPIIKIGTTYWMQSNLQTTHYNNGKNITKKTPSRHSSTSPGYFLVGSHYFYNKKAVLSGNIPPHGWRIAQQTDWDKLITYTKNKAAILKGYAHLWGSDNYPATNLTGFNAQPTGVFTQSIYEEKSVYGYADKYAAFWSMGNTPTSLSEYGVILSRTDNTIRKAGYSDYCGYSIRCVRE